MILSTLDSTSALCQFMLAMVTEPQSCAWAADEAANRPKVSQVEESKVFMFISLFWCGGMGGTDVPPTSAPGRNQVLSGQNVQPFEP